MSELAKTRRESLRDLRDQVAKIFAETDYRSAMICVSQYWNDGADDEPHMKLVCSRRDQPIWPHYCENDGEPDYDEEGNELPMVTSTDTDGCSWCGGSNVPYVDHGSTAETRAFETFCHEHANQEQSIAENYLPYAVFRRRDNDAIDIEVIGVPERPYSEIEPLRDARATWIDDPKARALYDLVCANPHDDGPRRVLGDYLLEREHPYGEFIALSLADELDADSASRRAELLEEQGRLWLGPLTHVIPYDSAGFERGFLAHAFVHAVSEEVEANARGHAAWSTVETIRLFPGSEPVLDESMIALREIGMLRRGDERVFEASRPWAIEKLRLRVDDLEVVDMLATTKLLPKLEELVVGGEYRLACVDRVAVPRLVVLDPHSDDETAWWTPSVSQLARGRTIAVAGEIDGDRAGWQLAFTGDRVEVSMVGWHPNATLQVLARRLRGLRSHIAIELVPSRYFTPVEADLAKLRDSTDRRIAIGGTGGSGPPGGPR